MATYLLDSDRSVGLPAVPLRVTAQVSGVPGAALELRSAPDSGTVAHRPKPMLLLLAQVRGSATVVVRSPDGTPFPEGATASLEITANARAGDDADVALLQGVRVGGLVERALLTVSRPGATIDVQAITSSTDEVDLGRLGDAARATVLSTLGVSTLGEGATRSVTIGADASASFRHRADDGSLAAVLDLLAGVSSVVAHGRSLNALLLGGTPTAVPVRGPEGLRAGVLDAVASAPRSSGVSARSLDPSGGAAFIVTDDPAAITSTPLGVHWVVLESEAVVLAGRQVDPPVTIIDPAVRGGLRESLLRDAQLLRTTISSLTTAWTAPNGRTVP